MRRLLRQLSRRCFSRRAKPIAASRRAYYEDWFIKLVHSRPEIGLGPFPPEDIQQKYNARSGLEVFRAALPVYCAFLDGAADLGLTLSRESALMDFGCGWGRFSQIALRDFDGSQIYSVDIAKEAIEYCENQRLPTNIVKTEPNQRIPLPDCSLDLIFSNSVFSHLSEAAHWFLVQEFRRLLKPGGVIAVTTRSRDFFTYVENLKKLKHQGETVPRHSRGVAESFQDLPEIIARYDAGSFVFVPIGEGKQLGSFYGEALIPEAYVERKWKPLFGATRYLPASARAGLEQNIIFATN